MYSVTFLYHRKLLSYDTKTQFRSVHLKDEAYMNINFQTLTGKKTTEDSMYVGMDAEDRINKSAVKSTSMSAVAVNLDTSLFSNDVYASHTRGTDDISEMAQNTDVMTQHNYMALLSNTMSEEDYKKALEDGFDVKNLNNSETVTILDKIKGVLLESGVEVTGFNDDMSVEKLTKITGSRTLAETIQKEFSKSDIPMTVENVRSAKGAYEEALQIKEPSDGAVKYMVLNNMKPTISNFYLAAHSTNGQNLSGRGFYAQEAGGYYAQKADSINWDSLAPQIDKVLAEAGYADGFSFSITVPSNYQQHVSTAEVLVEQYKKIGVTAEIKLVEWNSWLEDVYMGRNFESTVIGVDASVLTAPALLSRFASDAKNNFINFSSKDYDAKYAEAVATTDDAKATTLYKECLQILANDAANVYIQDLPTFVALNKKYAGYKFYPLYVQDFASLYIVE